MQFVQDPSKLESIVLANILANYQEIYNDMQQMVDDANADKWKVSGNDAAKIVPLSFGPVPAEFDEHMWEYWPIADWVVHADHPYLELILNSEHPIRMIMEFLQPYIIAYMY